jgi:polysaccharide biosynthesis protein PslG
MQGMVEGGGLANRLRDNPGVNIGAMIGQMPPGSEFDIIDGPQCDPDDELRWWLVNFNGLEGWTAEGEGEEYYIAPPGEAGGGGGDAASTAGASDAEKAAVDDIIKELPEPSAAELDRSRMGVQIYGTGDTATWQRALDNADALDTEWIKLQLNWSDVQADGPDMLGPSFETFRSLVQAADGRGLRILVSIAKAPDWTRAETYDFAGPPDDPQALADFITRVLAEIGPNIDAIEIWNEPNLNREWTGALPFDGAGYMQLFVPAHDAIRAFSEDIIIVTAGLAPTSDSDGSVDDRKFLRQMYEAGLAEYTDIVIGIHPYGWGNPPDIRCCDAVDGEGWDDNSRFFFLSNIEDFRSITQENEHDVQLWATEFGWGTWTDLPGDPPEGWMVYNTPDDQSNYTVRAFQIGQAFDYMGPMFLWNLNFADSIALEGRHETAAYSLIIGDSLIRPLFDILANSS